MVMSGVGGLEILLNLRRNDFDQLNLFQSMTCVSKEYKIKTKMYLYKNVVYLLLLGEPD